MFFDYMFLDYARDAESEIWTLNLENIMAAEFTAKYRDPDREASTTEELLDQCEKISIQGIFGLPLGYEKALQTYQKFRKRFNADKKPYFKDLRPLPEHKYYLDALMPDPFQPNRIRFTDRLIEKFAAGAVIDDYGSQYYAARVIELDAPSIHALGNSEPPNYVSFTNSGEVVSPSGVSYPLPVKKISVSTMAFLIDSVDRYNTLVKR